MHTVSGNSEMCVGWWPKSNDRDSLIAPIWLSHRSCKPIQIVGWNLSDQADIKLDWVVVDWLAEVGQILHQLELLRTLLKPGGLLWFSITREHEAMRGGCSRWEWLADLAGRMGWSCKRSKTGVGELLYLELCHEVTSETRWNLLGNQPVYTKQCQDLFERAFNHEISSELWEWKYGEGRGLATIAQREGKVIAHYGCCSRNVVFNGQIVKALQICDVMVDPKERAVMTKHGAFFNVALAAQEAFIGYGCIYEFGYGFPNQRHMQLAAKVGLYDQVERLVEMEWMISENQRNSWASRSELNDAEYLEAIDVDSLWEKMQAQMSGHILVMRNMDYVRYRYMNNPQHNYVAVVVRQRMTGHLIGLAILRPEGEECRLMDVVGEPRYFCLLLKHARIAASNMKMRVLKLWITENSWRLFSDGDERCTATDIVIPLNRHVQIRCQAEVVNRWFLMMGDTDFL